MGKMLTKKAETDWKINFFLYSKWIGEITCQHNDIAEVFSALSRPVWEFFIALMAKHIIFKVKVA